MSDLPQTELIHTRVVTQPLGGFKRFRKPSATPLKLSALLFMFPTGQTTEIAAQPKIVLGRKEKGDDSVDIDLTPFGGVKCGVSRIHGALHITDKTVYVTDYGSRNGMYLNGEELFSQRDYIVENGDTLKLGTLKMQVMFIS